MRKLIKIFAIWLIAITLPVEGFASVALMNCDQSPSSYSHNELANHNHDQHDDHGINVDESLQSSDPESLATENTKHSCAHCVKCIGCCSGFTVQTNQYNLFQQLPISDARFSNHSLLTPSFIPYGLERPPRFALI